MRVRGGGVAVQAAAAHTRLHCTPPLHTADEWVGQVLVLSVHILIVSVQILALSVQILALSVQILILSVQATSPKCSGY